MKTYPPCPGCARSMVSHGNLVPVGMTRYGGHGLCNACLNRRSRHGAWPEPALPFDSRPWVEQAACTTVDPDLFFPENGGSSPGQVRAAKAVCGRCPSSLECLAYSLGNDEVFGIWGGLTVRERQRLGRRGAA